MPQKRISMIIFTAVMSLLMTLYADANVLTNPGFETGTTSGWSPFGGCTIAASTTSHTGSYSALVSNRSDTWQGIRQDILETWMVG